MDLSTLGTSIQTTLGAQLPAIAAGLGILILGWLVAVVVRAGVRRGLGLVKLNAHIAGTTERAVNVESGIAAGAVAIALSFGLGGREAAGRQVDRWLTKLRGE
jgi:hypothetical protein